MNKKARHANKLYMAAGVLAIQQVRPCAHFPAGLTRFFTEIPSDHIQVTVNVNKNSAIFPMNVHYV